MTTDVSSTTNARLQLQQTHHGLDRVKSAPQAVVESNNSLRSSLRPALRKSLAQRRKTTCGASSSLRQSIKFSTKDFVTKACGDLEMDYDMGPLLGEGAYGGVYACTHKETGAERAVKIVPKSLDEKQNDMVIQEFNVLKELDHPNIVKNYALYETDTHFHIVTDVISGGELYDLLESEFSEMEVRELLKALLTCMNYCHQQRIVHRDLKPENVLMEESHDFTQVKVIDFGLAEFIQADNNFTEAAGSSYYMSPQVIQGNYTSKCDIWSCGVIAYVCLGGYAPFSGADEQETAQQILDATQVYFDDPVWDDFSEDALDFIEYLLTYDEDERPTAAQALQHAWLQHCDDDLSEAQVVDMDKSARVSLESLKAFHAADSKLKQCTYSLIASQIVRKEEKEYLDKIFQMIDVDCDGQISADDMRTIYNDKFGIDLQQDDLDGILYEVNLSGSGSISYSEFVIASMLEKGVLVTEHNLELAFQMMDTTQSGFLTFETLKSVLGVDDDMENYVQQRIIRPADLDGDGKISLQDFKGFFAGRQPRSSVHSSVSSRRSCRSSSVRRSCRKSFRASALLQPDPSDIDAGLAALRAEFNGPNYQYQTSSSMMMASSSVLNCSIGEDEPVLLETSLAITTEDEPTFKKLLSKFELESSINTNVPSMFRPQGSSSSGLTY
ncbi:MAP kinase-activated protein kinase 2 (Fragment) [Seminavis robusta]|uniref:non-specific serine/threonine protein kinase n=1 Tax=Seminavis robusta TaxID=568900 RepID=A0A9N8H8X0_9STRA